MFIADIKILLFKICQHLHQSESDFNHIFLLIRIVQASHEDEVAVLIVDCNVFFTIV